MKRLRTKEPKNFDNFQFRVPKSYIRNKNTVNELQELCDFYDIEYKDDFIKDDYVRKLRKFGKKNKLRKLDLVYKNPRGGGWEIKLTDTWLDVATDVVSESVNAYAMTKKELYRLIVDEIEYRRRKSKEGKFKKGDKRYMSEYEYKKCDIAYRTFMSYVNAENSYKWLDEKSAQLLDELQQLIEMKETRQKSELFKKMVADDTKGRQRYWELISTKDDRWNKTKKVDKKLDWQVAMENMMSEIADEKDDLADNSENEPESD